MHVSTVVAVQGVVEVHWHPVLLEPELGLPAHDNACPVACSSRPMLHCSPADRFVG